MTIPIKMNINIDLIMSFRTLTSSFMIDASAKEPTQVNNKIIISII